MNNSVGWWRKDLRCHAYHNDWLIIQIRSALVTCKNRQPCPKGFSYFLSRISTGHEFESTEPPHVQFLPVPLIGWKSSVRAYGHVISKFSRMGRLLHFLTHGTPLRFYKGSTASPSERSQQNLAEKHDKLSTWWYYKLPNINGRRLHRAGYGFQIPDIGFRIPFQ